MAPTRLEIVDYDEAGNATASYIESEAGGRMRVDVILPKESKNYVQQILDVFLPAGYPHSVTDDYIYYQIYDSLQAFSSSIAGLLASRAVLEGVGVGDANASPTAALLFSVLQESMGRLATILFAHKLGTSLEPECKMYRLTADILNDTAMVLDCLSPAFPKAVRVLVLSFSSVLRALCGVCAGSSKASLSAHFAKKGNLGELNAKDSSQETVISLLGMLTGSLLISHITSPLATWLTLVTLLTVHLSTNYAAVRAVSMNTLNRQRANIVFATALETGHVPTPQEVARRERVFERDGVLRWASAPSPSTSNQLNSKILGHAQIGVPFAILLDRLPGIRRRSSHTLTRETETQQDIQLSALLHLFATDAYIVWWDEGSREAVIVLKQGCTDLDQLRAWVEGLVLAKRSFTGTGTNKRKAGTSKQKEEMAVQEHGSEFANTLQEIKDARAEVERVLGVIVEKLRGKGWQLDRGCLETGKGIRVLVGGSEKVMGLE